ncbi:MAG: hypothetical protein AB3N11_05190, partial [Arenibacterium sp.]
KANNRMTPIQFLWIVGRNGPEYRVQINAAGFEFENFKIAQHQLALAVSLAPVGALFAIWGNFGQCASKWVNCIATALLVFSAIAAFLRLCLVAWARRRLRRMHEEKVLGNSDLALKENRLLATVVADLSAFVAYICLFILCFFLIWG